jgi:hypothetical protein
LQYIAASYFGVRLFVFKKVPTLNINVALLVEARLATSRDAVRESVFEYHLLCSQTHSQA